MTDLFREYVTKFLKRIGIDENVEFETSDEDFGTLKWSGGVMYEYGGNRLACGDITWILEESDIKPLYGFKEINQLEAMIELESGSNSIYTKPFNAYASVALVDCKTRLRINTPCGYNYPPLIKFLDMKFYKKV